MCPTQNPRNPSTPTLRESITLPARSAAPALRFPHPRCSPNCQGERKSWAPVSWSLQNALASASPASPSHRRPHLPPRSEPPSPRHPERTNPSFRPLHLSSLLLLNRPDSYLLPSPCLRPPLPPTLSLLTPLTGTPPNLCAHPGSTSQFPGMSARGGTPGRKGGGRQESREASRRRLAACSQPPSGTRALFSRE